MIVFHAHLGNNPWPGSQSTRAPCCKCAGLQWHVDGTIMTSDRNAWADETGAMRHTLPWRLQATTIVDAEWGRSTF